MKDKNSDFAKFKEIIEKEKKIYHELSSLENYFRKADSGEKSLILSQMLLLEEYLKRTNSEIPGILKRINTDATPLPAMQEKKEIKEEKKIEKEIPAERKTGISVSPVMWAKKYSMKELKPTELEKKTLKRMRKKLVKKEAERESTPNVYIMFANKLFSDFSEKIINKKTFEDLERDLIKGNLKFTSRSYISVIFLSTFISIFIGIVLALFFLFFNLEAMPPFITRVSEAFGLRLIKIIWIPILAPFLTFTVMYIYPGLEKSSAESRIDEELPFATIHMSAISGAMIDPSKIFDIIILTKEYPFLEKEFKKLLNEINIYGYDLVSALRNRAYNSPSKKLSELMNGLATTINSGGYLPEFFEKRSQTLLFEHNLEKEKKTKAAETFMDIYISIVIAAPMILMVLLMMMKISGLGISLSTSMITLIMVLSVTMINIVFLTFLQLKR